ncbi:hypothetical protein [Xenorhabdus sp. KJ12.1]|uniref:hypothetical protein n=1 Tax=Xenorhabdus sp. KJ12.1 TaxID=1851571 RepID=UPI000C03CDB3|nr:hypothetical protein [Xenorhabdus sp. KJ12.1]PHM72181.1 hypothetical protein Xekj_00459 [Xenorhabdus sp. KJ12.1]
MAKLKTFFQTKEEINAYEGLVLAWPCVEKISTHLISLLPTVQQKLIASAIQEAIAAYHQPYPFYMTDWERLAVYLIMTINFTTKILAGKMSFYEIATSCFLPRRMTAAFIEDTARKISMELIHA